jgi:gamma-glutamyl phosphate reductase
MKEFLERAKEATQVLSILSPAEKNRVLNRMVEF